MPKLLPPLRRRRPSPLGKSLRPAAEPLELRALLTGSDFVFQPKAASLPFAGQWTRNIDLGHFVDTGVAPGQPATTYEATIQRDDGSEDWAPGPSGFEVDSIDGEIFDAHEYYQSGLHTVVVTLYRVPANSSTILASGSFTTTVNVLAPASDASGATVSGLVGDAEVWEIGSFQYPDPRATADWFSTGFAQDGFSPAVIHDVGGGKFVITEDGAFSGPLTGPFSIGVVGPANQNFVLHGQFQIHQPPLSVVNESITEPVGATFNGVVASFTEPGASATTADFQATIDWGDGSPTTAGMIQIGSSGSFFVLGAHAYSTAGTDTVQVKIQRTDDPAVQALASSVFQALPPFSDLAASPVTALQGDSNDWEVATFTATNPDAPAGDFSASVAWTDAAHPNDTPSIHPLGGGQFLISDSRTFANPGTYPFSVTLTSKDGTSQTVTGTLQVAYQPISPVGESAVVPVGDPFDGVIAAFSTSGPDAVADNFTATIDWGDGWPTTAGWVQDGPNGTFLVVGDHTYTTAATEAVHVTIVERSEPANQATATSTVTVEPAFSDLSAVPISVRDGDSGPRTVATFSTPGTVGSAADFLGEVAWSDQPSNPARQLEAATIQALGDGQFAVTVNRTFDEPGTYPFSVTLVGKDGKYQTVPGTLRIADAPMTASPIDSADSVLMVDEGVESFVAVARVEYPAGVIASAHALSVAINWGDGTSSVGSSYYPGQGSDRQVYGTHTYLSPGTYLVRATMTDVTGDLNGGGPPTATVSAAESVTVRPDQPSLFPFPSPISATEGVPLPPSTTLAYLAEPYAGHSASEYSVLVDWGDGTASFGTVVLLTGSYAIDGGHTYLDPGSYTVHVSVRDKDGQTATTAETLNVASLPSSLSGALDPNSDSGVSNSDGITNDRAPTFRGQTTPEFLVTLLATSVGGSQAVQVGQGLADASGNWSVTTVPLADGSYTITAVAHNAAGRARNSVNLTPNAPLVIDTAAPTVSLVSFNPRTGLVTLSLGDAASPPSTASLSLAPTNARNAKQTLHPTISTAKNPDGSLALLATFNRGKRLAAAAYNLSLSSGAFADRAGNVAAGFASRLSTVVAKPVVKKKK